MLNKQLENYHLILASGSPRRQQFFKDLGLDFSIRLKPVDEVYPETLQSHEISDYLARLKAEPFEGTLQDNEILITSDTIVWHNNKALGKPKDANDAFNMIKSLSNTTHDVITSVCFTGNTIQKVVHATTTVSFKALTDDEIRYYIEAYKPFDKAGAYGIQEWIGYVGVTKIEGSYFNVMGLPVHLVYKSLIEITA